MGLGSNIQFLRKQKRITQEQLAEHMGVSRQTVSRWESEEVIPELGKLVEMCSLFSCKLDALVREDIPAQADIYSPVSIRHLAGFQMARYVIISPNPEDDVNGYMDRWAQNCGLLSVCPEAMRIGWDFPFVTQEQQNRFGLRGYAAAYVLPEGFKTACPGVEYARNQEADYAVITVTEPFAQPFERIPNAYKQVLDYLAAGGFKEKPSEQILSCFEHVYQADGVTYMDVYLHADRAS